MTCTLPPREAQEHFGILVWTFAVLMHPEFILESPIEVTCFEFNPGQPNVVVGGCCNGQIIMWDYGRVSLFRITTSKRTAIQSQESAR